MAQEQFVEFFSRYLPQHADLAESIASIADPGEFVVAVMTAGKEAGYDFSEVDVERVMQASLRDALAKSGELTEQQLETVAGGLLSLATVPRVQITSLASTKNAVLTANTVVAGESTWMCSH